MLKLWNCQCACESMLINFVGHYYLQNSVSTNISQILTFLHMSVTIHEIISPKAQTQGKLWVSKNTPPPPPELEWFHNCQSTYLSKYSQLDHFALRCSKVRKITRSTTSAHSDRKLEFYMSLTALHVASSRSIFIITFFNSTFNFFLNWDSSLKKSIFQ